MKNKELIGVCSKCEKKIYEKGFKYCPYCGGSLYAPDWLIIKLLERALNNNCSEQHRNRAIKLAIRRIKELRG